MKFLLDTNVLSELLKPEPDSTVVGWMQEHQLECAMSSLTLAEMAAGSRWHPLPKLFIPYTDLEILKPWRFGIRNSNGIYIELPRGDFAKRLSQSIVDDAST